MITSHALVTRCNNVQGEQLQVDPIAMANSCL